MFGWLKKLLGVDRDVNIYLAGKQRGEMNAFRDSRGRYAKKPLWMRDPIVAEQVRGWEKKYHCKYKLKG